MICQAHESPLGTSSGRQARVGRWVASLAIAMAVSVASGASAQTGAADKAAAEALYAEGKRLMQAGSYAEACPKLAESQRVDPAVGTLLYLGECYEKNGQTASAWAAFRSAESAARNAGQAAREQTAHERAAALEPGLSKLTIVMAAGPSVPGLEVRRDGVVVGGASFGIAIPVDPGSHVVEASAPGFQPWKSTMTVAPGGAAGSVTVPSLQPAPTPPPATAPPGPEPAPSATVMTPPPAASDAGPQPDPGRGDGQRVAGVVAGILGVGALGVGTAFFIRKGSKTDDYRSCVDTDAACIEENRSLKQDATSAQNIGIGSMIGAGALLVGGIVLYATAPRDAVGGEVSGGKLRAVPVAGPGYSGLWLTGSL